MCRLAEAAAQTDDPELALRTLTELRGELDEFVRIQVGRGLSAGRSFGEVARALGISRQAAHRRYRELAPTGPRAVRRLAATEQARRVLRLAYAETLARDARAAESGDLLVAVLQTDGEAARALRSEGVTLEKARTCTRKAHSSPDDGGERHLRRLVRRAGGLAVANGDRHLGPEHLLLAAIADADGGAVRILTALGADPAAIRARLEGKQHAS